MRFMRDPHVEFKFINAEVLHHELLKLLQFQFCLLLAGVGANRQSKCPQAGSQKDRTGPRVVSS